MKLSTVLTKKKRSKKRKATTVKIFNLTSVEEKIKKIPCKAQLLVVCFDLKGKGHEKYYTPKNKSVSSKYRGVFVSCLATVVRKGYRFFFSYPFLLGVSYDKTNHTKLSQFEDNSAKLFCGETPRTGISDREHTDTVKTATVSEQKNRLRGILNSMVGINARISRSIT